MTFGLVAGYCRGLQHPEAETAALHAAETAALHAAARAAPRAGLTRRTALLGGAAALGLGAGCASAPKPVVTPVSGTIEASAKLNPSVNGRPSPLLLRVYELRSNAVFGTADFMALYQSDQATLAADLVARDEFMLQPGERRPYAKTLGGETRFVAVFAAYRNLERAVWRTAAAVQLGRPHTLTIRADELAVVLELKP